MARKEHVARVRDGDSFSTDSRKRDVRLADVHAPDKGERGYATAKEALKKMIGGKEVMIETVGRDSYGRSVAKVKVSGKSVNRAMQRKTGR